MPPEVLNHLGQLQQTSTLGKNAIVEAIRKIDEFSPEELTGNWRPAKEIGGILSNARVAKEMLGALQRDLEYWGERLEARLPPTMGNHFEAIEGPRRIEQDANENEPGVTVLTNRPENARP